MLAGATFAVSSPGQPGVLQRTLTNHGFLTWDQASLQLNDGATIVNETDATFVVLSNLSITNSSGSPVTLINRGNLIKNSVPGGPISLTNVAFVNEANADIHLNIGQPTDSITSNAAGVLGGAFNVGVQPGFVPAIGSTFDVFSFASLTGTFGVVQGNGQTYSTTYSATGLTLTTDAVGNADLALTMTDSPDPVAPGSPLTYSFTVTNDGPDFTEVTVFNSLPANVTLVSATPSQGECFMLNALVCDLDGSRAGRTPPSTIVVTANQPGTLFNSRIRGQRHRRPNFANNVVSATTLVTANPDSVFTVTTTATSGAGSLRQAILDANAHANGAVADLIPFDIPGTGPFTITPAPFLPVITRCPIIDATTQPGIGHADRRDRRIARRRDRRRVLRHRQQHHDSRLRDQPLRRRRRRSERSRRRGHRHSGRRRKRPRG